MTGIRVLVLSGWVLLLAAGCGGPAAPGPATPPAPAPETAGVASVPTATPTATLAATATPTPTSTPTPTPTLRSEQAPTETPQPALELKPATMTKAIAARYLAGGEWASEEELSQQFAGRVFVNESGETFILARPVYEHLVAQLGEGFSILSPEEQEQALAQALGQSEWGRLWQEEVQTRYKEMQTYRPEGLSRIFFVDGSSTAPLLLNPTPEDIKRRRTIRSLTRANFFRYDEKGEIDIGSIEFVKKEFTDEGYSYYGDLIYQYSDTMDKFIAHDGYQARFVYDLQTQSWRPILPHERQYILTPDQQIKYIVHKLRTERSAYNEPYVFDDYITTKRREDVPQIVILVTNTQVSSQEQQWINDWYLNDGKNLTAAQKQRVQALIPKIGNGFTRRQAEAIARWIDQFLDRSEYAREIFRIADVRFIAQNNAELSKETGGRWKTKYASGPNHYNNSLWGIDVATYYPEMIPLAIFPHEVGRVYLSQTMANYDDEKDLGPLEKRLLKEAPPPFSF